MRGLRRLNQRHREITEKRFELVLRIAFGVPTPFSYYPLVNEYALGNECFARLGNIGEREGEKGGYPGNEHVQTSHRCVSYTCTKLTEAWLGDTRFAGNALVTRLSNFSS